jgi:hypothetical protein
VFLVALVGSGCGSGAQDRSEDPSGSTARPSEPVDSSLRFHGQRREIAQVIENYEVAVRSGNAAALCRRVLQLNRRRAKRTAIDDCIRDPDNDALARSIHVQETLDLVVRRIALPPRRPGAVPGIPAGVRRYLIEDDLEEAPRAVALAEAADRDGGVATAFGLSRRDDEWRIARKWRAAAVETPEGGRARVEFFQLHGVLGFYGIGRTGVPHCRTGEAGITHWIVPPRPAGSVRDAVMRSNIGPRLRRALRNGGTLPISAVDYAGPTRTFTLYAPSGRAVLWFDAHGVGPRYVTDGIWGCRGWLERFTHLGLHNRSGATRRGS